MGIGARYPASRVASRMHQRHSHRLAVSQGSVDRVVQLGPAVLRCIDHDTWKGSSEQKCHELGLS